MMDVLDEVEGLEDAQKAIIQANMEVNLAAVEGYRQKVTTLYSDVYNGAARASLTIDNTHFTSELLGHVEGAMVELARNKLLTLFKSRARGSFLL